MIDSLSYLLLVVFSICLSQIFLNSHVAVRLGLIALSGMVLIYAVAPLALLYAIACIALSLMVYFVGTRYASLKLKSRLPYTILFLLFLPDVFNLVRDKPVVYLGAAFFIIRIMMTLSEALKKDIKLGDYFPAVITATFFIGALPSGPVYSGLDVWREIVERKPVNYKEGVYRLFEGFVCLFAVAGFVNMVLMDIGNYAYSGSNLILAIIYGLPYIIVKSLLAFGFLFSTFYGYSRMAEGSALLMGFSVPQNFDNPHLATDLSNFWKRWHRSMAKFVMQYIYLPLLVSYKNAKFALMFAFLFMGVWHKLSLEFMIWGLGHGIGLAYLMPWLQRCFSSSMIIRVVSLCYVVFLSSIAHEVWTS